MCTGGFIEQRLFSCPTVGTWLFYYFFLIILKFRVFLKQFRSNKQLIQPFCPEGKPTKGQANMFFWILTVLLQFPFSTFLTPMYVASNVSKRSFIFSWNAICPDPGAPQAGHQQKQRNREKARWLLHGVCVGEWGLTAGYSCACGEISGTIRRKKQNSYPNKRNKIQFSHPNRSKSFISPNRMWNRKLKKIMEGGKYKHRLWVSIFKQDAQDSE